MTNALDHPVVVELPVRGDGWMAVTTPATKVPSHGTDLLGQRYAYDLLRVDDRPEGFYHPAGRVRGLLVGGRTRDCYAWGATVHAPFDAEVVRVVDGMAERRWINPIWEAALLVKNGLTFRKSRLQAVLGNHVILRHGDVYAGFAHFTPGSIEVVEGQRVLAGDLLGRVGHSGNSTSPHLHFQLMDSADLLVARGIPCAFRRYEVERGGSWLSVTNGIPARRDRVRGVGVAG